jgi:hypothetical protein
MLAEAEAEQEVLGLRAQAVLAVVVQGVMQLLFQPLARQILVAGEVLVETSKIILLLAVQALSSSVTPTLLTMPLQPQVRHRLATLVDIKFIAGQVLVQLHSEVTHGTFCTT